MTVPAVAAPSWSRRRSHLVAGGLYLGLSLALWWGVWTTSPTTTTICGCGDSSFTLWFQTFAAHALAQGSNPFFTTLLWHPHGVNVLDDASQLGLGLPMAPVTWLFGAVASMNLALTASTFLSAGAMYLLLEHWYLWRPGAFVGGLVYGFSPIVLTNLAEARLIVTMLVLPPLIVWCLDRLVRGTPRPGRLGVALGLLIVAQFFISSEVLVMTAMACALGLVAAAVAGGLRGELTAARLWPALTGFAVALGTAGVLLAYPAWFVLFGPAHIAGKVYPSANLGANGVTALGFIWPQPVSAAFTSFSKRVGGYQGPIPSSQYVGLTMAVALVFGLAWFRRDRRLWLYAGIGLVFGWLALGSSSGGWLPWDMFVNAPVLENIIPTRFLLVSFFCLGGVVALLGDHLVRRLRAGSPGMAATRANGVGMVVLAIMLLPPFVYYATLVPLTTEHVVLPTWFQTVAPRLPPDQVLLVIPAPFSVIQSSMTWQSENHLRFSMAGGDGPGSDLSFAGRDRLAQQLLASVSGEFVPTAVTPAGIVAVRRALEHWGVDEVVMPVEPDLPSYDQPFAPVAAASLITAATGEAPVRQAKALVWRVAGDRHGPLAVPSSAFDACATSPGATPAEAARCLVASRGA